MTIFASFNYYPPPPTAIVVGVLVGLLLLILAGLSRRVLVSIPLTCIGWAVIAWVVCFQGTGDMTIIMAVFFGGTFGLAGAVVGGITTYCCKTIAKRAKTCD